MNDVQTCILNVFTVVSELCEKHNIPYFAIGGTCIGAVRHKGFIPWDDDIDIAIPIEHFREFRDICINELPPGYEYYDGNNAAHYPNVFSKVTDSRTTFVEEVNKKYPDTYKGVFVDIMPLSGVPESASERKRFLRKQHFYNIANNTRRFSFAEMPNLRIKLLWIILKVFNTFSSIDVWSQKWLNLLETYPLKGSTYTGYVWSGRLSKLIFPTSYFVDSIVLPFENTTMRCPVGFDGYLRLQFGDYMQLPKESDRVSGHQGIVDLEKSYKIYQDERSGGKK